MPDSRNLPSSMCAGCAHYEYHKGQSSPHHCKDPGSFANYSKVGQNPDNNGTASNCKAFKKA